MAYAHSSESKSCWFETAQVPQLEPLKENLNVDVCIVGAGIAGLTTAYLLLQEGKSVCVLDSLELGRGQSGKTSAHVSAVLGTRYADLELYHGAEGIRLIAQSHTAALNKIEHIIRKEQIECELERIPGFLFSSDQSDHDDLVREHRAVHRAGLIYSKMIDQPLIEDFNTGPCLTFPRQLQLHPLKYLIGLAECILRLGGKIFINSPVIEFYNKDFAAIKTLNNSIVTCSEIVVATNAPINDVFAIHTKQAAYRSYCIGFKIKKNSLPKGLFWDTDHPYHYFRTHTLADQDYDWLIVGGEDHKTGQHEHPELCYQKLEAWAKTRFKSIIDIDHKWSGQVMEPVDGIGFLGHNPLDRNNVYVITGDAGNGFTHTTIGAMIITDQITKRQNPWEDLYNPSRISLLSTVNYFRENFNVATQYGKWLAVKPKKSPEYLKLNEGQIFRDGLSMIAMYKNESGVIHYMSAACPHLGGVVSWNNVEKSWDCPCHGARFNGYGHVLEGPAITNLKPLDSDDFIDPDVIPNEPLFPIMNVSN